MQFDLKQDRYDQMSKAIIDQYKKSGNKFTTWLSNQNDASLNRRVLLCARYYLKKYCRPFIKIIDNKFYETIENRIYFDLYNWTEVKKHFKFLDPEQKLFVNYIIATAALSELTNVYDIFITKSGKKCIIGELEFTIAEAKSKTDEIAIETFAHYVENSVKTRR